MTTLPNKALAACRRYVEAQSEVRRLTTAIGEALRPCPFVQHTDTKSFDSHLALAYAFDGPITEDRLACCPHCIAAHALVQERKRARVAFAVAKRMITVAGKGQV